MKKSKVNVGFLVISFGLMSVVNIKAAPSPVMNVQALKKEHDTLKQEIKKTIAQPVQDKATQLKLADQISKLHRTKALLIKSGK